jgi:hypothetical protein
MLHADMHRNISNNCAAVQMREDTHSGVFVIDMNEG